MIGFADQSDGAERTNARPVGFRRFADLGPRLASGLVLVALALGTAYVGGRPFALLWWAASVAIVWEMAASRRRRAGDEPLWSSAA